MSQPNPLTITMLAEQQDGGASAAQTGPSQAEPEVSALRASVPSAGISSLREIGVDHYYETGEWDCTYNAGDLEFVNDALCEGGAYGKAVLEITTLVEGPRLYAIQFPISWVEGSDPGDIDDWELRFFACAEEARAAVAQAIETRRAETQGGSVHESAVATPCAQNQSSSSPNIGEG